MSKAINMHRVNCLELEIFLWIREELNFIICSENILCMRMEVLGSLH